MNIFEKEIMRRVKELDCKAIYHEINGSISVTYDGVHIAEISFGTADKVSGLTDEETKKFLHIKRLCENVANYCEAYESGEPIDIPDFSDGYRVIFSVGNAKMAARFDRASGFEFIIWSDYEYPRFYEDYNEACGKYAVLSGLVDAERVFSDEELQTLCYCVYAVTEMCDTLTDDMTKLLNDLGKKLDIAVSRNYTKNGGEKHGCKV